MNTDTMGQVKTEWVETSSRFTRHGDVIVEAKQRKEPFEECPHCGKYKFKEFRTEETEKFYPCGNDHSDLFSKILHILFHSQEIRRTGWKNHYKKCSNCKYREDVE